MKRNLIIQIEPVGSSPPRVPSRAKTDVAEKPQGGVVTLLCEAQSYPAPLYR